MFTQIITDTLMIFLITYALIDILCRLLNLIERFIQSEKGTKKLLLYCDSDENLENLVRSSAKTAMALHCELILILKKETHESEKIANRLQGEFPYLHVIKFSDEVIFQIFEDVSSEAS